MTSLRHNIANVVSVLYTGVKLTLLKIIYPKQLHIKGIIRFSPNVVINIEKNSSIFLGNRISMHSRGRISSVAGGKLEIEDNCSFNVGCIIACRHNIRICRDVTIGPNTMIYDHNHIMNTEIGVKNSGFDLKEVKIGKNTWIGAGVIILAGADIGENCVIAAGSIITGKIPDNTVVVQKRESIYKNV